MPRCRTGALIETSLWPHHQQRISCTAFANEHQSNLCAPNEYYVGCNNFGHVEMSVELAMPTKQKYVLTILRIFAFRSRSPSDGKIIACDANKLLHQLFLCCAPFGVWISFWNRIFLFGTRSLNILNLQDNRKCSQPTDSGVFGKLPAYPLLEAAD